MRSSFSRGLTVGALAAIAGICAPTAFAAEPRSQSLRLTVSEAQRQFCATKSVTGAGVERRSFTSPVEGIASVRLSGPASSDWDMAIVDQSSDKVLDGSANLGSSELASAFVSTGQNLVVQACRRSGSAATVGLSVDFTPIKRNGASDYTTKMVRVSLGSKADFRRLERLGLDTTDHATETYVDVLLYSAADERTLRGTGMDYATRVADVRAKDNANRQSEQRARRSARSRAAARAATPGARTTYRTLPEINEDLKRLAEENPGLVRLTALPLQSWEGRDIMGIEIAENVAAPADGRPVYVQIGTHHAREWPANEATLEFGIELINGYKTGNARLAGIVRGARTFVIPVLNVDGFDVTIKSEGLAPGGNYTNPMDSGTASGSQGRGSGAYKRKNCRPVDPAAVQPRPQGECLARSYPNTLANRDRGVDPNRNYGVEWGGPGTSSRVESLVYHGPGPFSEPETEGFRRFIRDQQPAVLITNHTFTGLILRPPGTNRSGPVPDEERLRTLGDAMARETNYVSQFSYQLYDTTGTTDDYLYDGLGAFSYTPEIGKEEFHPAYSEFQAEYDGREGTNQNGDPSGQQLGGLREAYTLAGETAVNSDSHAVIEGTAPAGRTLRITKSITYKTSERPNDDGVQNPVQTITEPRNSTMEVPANGAFTWHVNPSRQPRDPNPTAWKLTCEDGAGNVLETKDVFVERAQRVNLGLVCGQGASATPPPQPTNTTQTSCVNPNGFRSTSVTRRGSGLRISFTKRTRNPVTVDVFQTSKGRRVIQDKRVIRFRNRQRSFTWNGRGTRNKRLSSGVYYVRFRVLDNNRKIDSRRVVVEKRASGRFVKRGGFLLESRCPR